MTRKDFQLIARAVNDAASRFEIGEGRLAIENFAHELANACEDVNPNFDRARFLRTCGVEG